MQQSYQQRLDVQSIQSFSVSPDIEQVAYTGSETENISLYNYSTQTNSTVRADVSSEPRFRWSSNGTFLYTQTENGIKRVTAHNEETTTYLDSSAHLHDVSPDGRYIAYSEDSQLKEYDTVKEKLRTIGNITVASTVRYSPSGIYLAVDNLDGTQASYLAGAGQESSIQPRELPLEGTHSFDGWHQYNDHIYLTTDSTWKIYATESLTYDYQSFEDGREYIIGIDPSGRVITRHPTDGIIAYGQTRSVIDLEANTEWSYDPQTVTGGPQGIQYRREASNTVQVVNQTATDTKVLFTLQK